LGCSFVTFSRIYGYTFVKFCVINYLVPKVPISDLSHFSECMYRQNRCYSCMSPMYEEFFKNGLDRYFTPPKNFSYQCDEPMNPESMHLVSCRTICLTVQQDLYVMGQPTGKRLFMRGCALTMARRGLNNHTLSMFDRYDICREMSAADLFRHDRADSQRVRVCSCLGDR
uniref:Lipase domain-containing protein n=1 Tax=Haemonchus placei TaxID=6290 RepID=A0A0N4WT89_HAEPC